MSTTALAAVLTKFAGLNIASKAVVGLAVAAVAVGGAASMPAVAGHFTGVPDAKQVASVQPVASSTQQDVTGTKTAATGATTGTCSTATCTTAPTGPVRA